MTVFDIILLVIMLLGLFVGYKRGFFGSITKPLKLILSICLTIVVSSPIINAWTRPFFTGKVSAWIYSSLLEAYSGATEGVAAEEIPSALKFMAELFNLDMSSLESGASSEEVLSLMADKMAAPIGNLIAVVVTYLALFIIFMILLKLVIWLFDSVFKKGLIGKVNKILGLLLGGVIAMVVACVVANIAGAVSADLARGAVTQFFKNINPFAIVMSF